MIQLSADDKPYANSEKVAKQISNNPRYHPIYYLRYQPNKGKYDLPGDATFYANKTFLEGVRKVDNIARWIDTLPTTVTMIGGTVRADGSIMVSAWEVPQVAEKNMTVESVEEGIEPLAAEKIARAMRDLGMVEAVFATTAGTITVKREF